MPVVDTVENQPVSSDIAVVHPAAVDVEEGEVVESESCKSEQSKTQSVYVYDTNSGYFYNRVRLHELPIFCH